MATSPNSTGIKHRWLPYQEGERCEACGVVRRPADKSRFRYAKPFFTTPEGITRNWIGGCPGPTSPLAGDPTKEEA